MLTKILFTLAVVVIVGLVFRHKQAPKVAAKEAVEVTDSGKQSAVEAKTVIYAILGADRRAFCAAIRTPLAR